jgi:hypothetical protein
MQQEAKVLRKNERISFDMLAVHESAPRDPDKLERLLRVKKRQKEEAIYFEDTQRLVTEIEMLKVVLYLMCRRNRRSKAS